MTGWLCTRMTLNPRQKKIYIYISSFGVQNLSACPFVSELIGCQGLWTDLCSFGQTLRLEDDFGAVNVQPEHCHGLNLCVITSTLTMLSSSASHCLTWARTRTQSIPQSSRTFYRAVTLRNSQTET